MLLHTNERLPLARLLQFIELGEHIAHSCAKAQAALAQDPGTTRFLQGQARQELLHARTFHASINWIAPKHLGASPFTKPFAQYQRLIASALDRGDLHETILAEQVILEGLGEVILKKLEMGLLKRQAPFQRLRRIFLQQEEAHHGFGLRLLERTIAQRAISTQSLQSQAQDYIGLAESMVRTGQALLVEINEDPDWYLTEFRKTLPDWIKGSPVCAIV
ncbi:ferritin-like domain-containing protein [Nitrospira sp. M1]